MRDKRSVDELSIEELERILAIKRREARQQQIERMERTGRIVTPAPPANGLTASPQPMPPVPAKINGSVQKPDTLPPGDESMPELTDDTPRFEDDPGYIVLRDDTRQDHAWKRFVNISLTLVEVVAVAGLVFLALNMLLAINQLEDETREAQQITNATQQAAIPTIAPTPTLRLDRVVLPGGHYFDNETGEALPNFAEIPDSVPDHLLPVVQQRLLYPEISRPEPTEQTARIVNIPALNVDHPIIQGADWDALRAGVGQVLNGYSPDHPTGNVVLAAHNDIYGELFRELDKLEVGDEFHIQTETQLYTYRVTGSEIVEPTDVYVLESQGKPTATLISCYPHGVNSHRYIVYADRVDT